MKRLFISDLHLDESRPALASAFSRFLEEKASKAEELYILGDFFDVWLGDDDVRPFNEDVCASLAALPGQVFIMHGNRDFLLGGRFCAAAGATLLPDPFRLDEATLLMHGDSLCTRDQAYMQARQRLRSPAFQQEFLAKPLDERAAFAREARGQSAAHTREAPEDIMDVTAEEVTRVMEEAGVRLLIHGHTHRPADHPLTLAGAPARRLVLGDWHQGAYYAEATPAQTTLCHYPF